MSRPAGFILDTNVLSSFYAVDWLSNLSFWHPERMLWSPERVWTEFTAYHNAEQPSWLEIHDVALEDVEVEDPMRLATADWACIILAETMDDGCVVTNDRAMHDAAEQRDVSYQWGTQFLLSTFHGCGISELELSAGLSEYTTDLGLTDRVVAEVKSAEK
ncbi:hypothetical protein ACFPYI_12090 [Halomarina salina]|uniref:PIN domain-containing protein n=1 Tax=Halomarina salina TaxID=1872699 RepID=A0ABD5RN56_9EURY|nr:hypothetical protein [Halomarina salina]